MNALDALMDRVKLALDVAETPHVLIAQHLGISAKHLSMVKNGRSDPSHDLLWHLCDYLDIS